MEKVIKVDDGTPLYGLSVIVECFFIFLIIFKQTSFVFCVHKP